MNEYAERDVLAKASLALDGGIHAGNRLGGNAIADIFTFGRIAGEQAAK